MLASIKEWMYVEDKVLSKLAKMIINRNLLKIEIQDKPFTEKYQQKIKNKLNNVLNVSEENINYFIFTNSVSNQAYNTKKPIKILTKKEKLKDIAKASDQLNLQALTKPVIKHYFCYPKKLILD